MESIIKDLNNYSETLKWLAEELEECKENYKDDDIAFIRLHLDSALYNLKRVKEELGNFYRKE